MNNGQLNIFDVIYPKFKIDKPIRLIEFFAGYGSQALALKYLGVEFQHWKICEWAVKSIQAYKDIHFTDDDTDYSDFISKESLIEILYKLGISSNYNEPMTKEQITRLNEKQLRTIYNNIKTTHNLVNIQQIKGEDLEIIDKDEYTYILSYSFPCQDLSNAGKKRGMSDTSTRSGMLWEVERILSECKELPQVLLMENVPQVHSEDNLVDFNKWKYRLEELGYKNYFQDLIATDYGIPQTRNRCFMISLLGDYNYTFPKSIPLELKLKDMLEDNVDEKYYLSDKMIKYIFSENDKYKVNKNSMVINRDIACSKTTREGRSRADTSDYITDELLNTYDEYNHKINGRETIGTIQAGYKNENHGHRLIMKKVNEMCDDLIKNDKVKQNDTLLTNFISRRIKENDIVQNNNISPTLTTSATEVGVCVGTYQYSKSDSFMQGKNRLQIGKEVSDTLQITQKEEVVYNDLRIRRLTERECFRLMGVKDEDFEKCSKNQSSSSLYHLAGDSIVVNVLMAIFKEML